MRRVVAVGAAVLRARRSAVAAVVALGALPATAGAAQFTVNNTTDAAGSCPTPTTCSLRQAIDDTNAASGDDVIVFSLPLPATITVATALTVNPTTSSDKLTIAGPGANLLTIAHAGPPNDRVFQFSDGTSTLSGVTVTGGRDSSLQAAGIENGSSSTLTLDGVVVTGNEGNAGNVVTTQAAGGVLNLNRMTILNSTISDNKVTNAGTGGGGGVVSHFGDLLIVNTTISGNQVTAGQAGGLSTGGGIWNAGGGDITLVNDTIANNSVANGGGGIFAEDDTDLANTIVARNTSGNGGNDCVGGTDITSRGYNLIGDADGCNFTANTGDQVGSTASPVDPLLAPLANYGGSTPTMALLAGSPAIDRANPAAVSDADPASTGLIPCRTTDQRGVTRPQITFCDIGAFEFVPAPPPPPAASGLGGGNAGGGGPGGRGPLVTGIGGPGGAAGLCGGGGAGGGGLAAGGGGAGGGGCFNFVFVQSLGLGQVIAFAGVATGGSTVRAEVIGTLPTARKARSSRAQLIGQKVTRGLLVGRYKVAVGLSSKAKRAFRRLRKVRVTLRLTMTAPKSRPLVATRAITLKR